MKTSLTLKRFSLYFMTTMSVLLLVFGIGLHSIKASTAANGTNLQPASGATEFRAEDNSTPTESTADSSTNPSHDDEADSSVLGMFGINWKLLLAQLVNFCIVLFVLWKWVFKPMTANLSQRTSKIEQSLKEADKINKDRDTFESWKQEEVANVRAEASAIIAEAKQHAEMLKADTIKQTTDEQNRLIEQGHKRLEQEKVAMLKEAKSELAEIVVQATSIILTEKIDPKKDKELIDNALKKAQVYENN